MPLRRSATAMLAAAAICTGLSGCGGTAAVADARLTGNVNEDPMLVPVPAAGEKVSAASAGYSGACSVWQKIQDSPDSRDTTSLRLVLDMIEHDAMSRSVEALIRTIESGYAVTPVQAENMTWLCSRVHTVA